MNLSRVPIIVWILIPTVLILGVGVWFFSRPSVLGEMTATNDSLKLVAVSTPVEGTQEFPVVSRQHIAAGTAGSGYNSNPPTSGVHWPAPAKNGVYDNGLPDEQTIHNLEHGYVWISYKQDVGDDTIAALSKIVKEDDWKVIMSPRDKNDSQIILASWGRLLNMDQFDEGKVKDFIKTYRNRGPEKTPD